jgi:hypothetical protein
MTFQATNRREGGLTSCSGKELKTVRAAQKLLGAPTISRGSAWPGGGGGGS